MAKKLCFILGAGGAKGIAHIGFLKAMEEANIKPDCIAGCSMGAVVGACYCNGVSVEEMKSVADLMRMKDIADLNIAPFNKKSLFRSVKMRAKVKSLLGNVTFDELKIPFECIATDIVTGKIITLNKGSVEEAVSASAAIPTIFRPIEKEGMELVDGGILMRLPFASAKHFKADVSVAVDVIGKLTPFKPTRSLLSQALRVIEVTDCFVSHKTASYYKPNVLVLPDTSEMSQFKVEKLDYAFDAGYNAGKEKVDEIKRLLD